jgi:hypothetical protein
MGSQGPVAHTCNPSYSEGRDQEDCGSKKDPISKIPNTKSGGRVAQGVGPEFKPSTAKKKKSEQELGTTSGSHLKSFLLRRQRWGLWFKASPGKKFSRPMSKITTVRWTGGVTQMVAHLLCNCKA